MVLHEKFTIDYFIDKFQDIKEEYFSLTSLEHPTDAWEWCTEEEAQALHELIRPFGILMQVNDGEGEWGVLGNTIKMRIIKFLMFVKRSRHMENVA